MARSDYLLLRHGYAPWAKWAHAALSFVGILAVMISPTSWTLKLATCLLLVGCFAVILLFYMNRRPSGLVRVFDDGTSLEIDSKKQRNFGTLSENQWISRWFCSLTVYPAKRRRKQYFLVFASENDPDEYRRLLKFIRMRSSAAQAQRMIW